MLPYTGCWRRLTNCHCAVSLMQVSSREKYSSNFPRSAVALSNYVTVFPHNKTTVPKVTNSGTSDNPEEPRTGLIIGQKSQRWRSHTARRCREYLYVTAVNNAFLILFLCVCWFVLRLIFPAVCCLYIICLSLSVFRLCKTVSVKNGWPAR